MALSEFEMIVKYFRNATPQRPDTLLSIGDDAALIRLRDGYQLVTVLKQWRAGMHYQASDSGADTGTGLLQQAIHELETLGAEPAWMTLSLTLDQLDEAWLAAFSHGLAGLARQYSIELIGTHLSHHYISIIHLINIICLESRG